MEPNRDSPMKIPRKKSRRQSSGQNLYSMRSSAGISVRFQPSGTNLRQCRARKYGRHHSRTNLRKTNYMSCIRRRNLSLMISSCDRQQHHPPAAHFSQSVPGILDGRDRRCHYGCWGAQRIESLHLEHIRRHLLAGSSFRRFRWELHENPSIFNSPDRWIDVVVVN